MLEVYIALVREGRRTLDSVPAKFRDDVKESIKKDNTVQEADA